MLKAHNSKTSTIVSGYNKKQLLKQKAKEEGIPYEQLVAEQPDQPVKKKKKFIKKKVVADVDVEIKVKGADG